VAIPVFLVVFKLYGLYDRDMKRISHSTVDDLPWLLHAGLTGGLLLWLYSKYGPMHQFSFITVLSFGAVLVASAVVFRSFVRRAVIQLLGADRALLVGDGPMAEVLTAKLAVHPEYRVNVVGTVGPSGTGLPCLGSLPELERIAREQQIGRILLAAGDLDPEQLTELLHRCRHHSLKVSLLPQLADTLGASVAIDDVEGVTVLGVNPPWLPRSSRALKRLMDVAVAAPLLVLSAPVLLALAVVIRLDSSGPALFSQERVGRGGRRFKVMKLRTMVRGAEQDRAELIAGSNDPNWLLVEDDPRVTRVGRRLRRMSLDELPQLWNVLRGEMSLVGPRPLIPSEDERVEGRGRGRLDLTPGITGYWQVLGRTRIPFEEMVKLDYLYVMNWSLWEDVRLILRTLPAVVLGRGAN
jgi:exopolysaccharide biosynthesis polyprenyl glycosylphosphotransferase